MPKSRLATSRGILSGQVIIFHLPVEISTPGTPLNSEGAQRSKRGDGRVGAAGTRDDLFLWARLSISGRLAVTVLASCLTPPDDPQGEYVQRSAEGRNQFFMAR